MDATLGYIGEARLGQNRKRIQRIAKEGTAQFCNTSKKSLIYGDRETLISALGASQTYVENRVKGESAAMHEPLAPRHLAAEVER